MHEFTIRSSFKITLVGLLSFSLAFPRAAEAEPGIKLKKWSGTIDFVDDGPSPFTMQGKATNLGRFEAFGEVEFFPGDVDGSLIGLGVGVFEDSKGDLLVGDVTWIVDSANSDLSRSSIQFHWRDFVEFSDGTVVSNTGRFIEDRPPGLVVIAIIAILIGLLLPAVQKVREAAARD